MEHLLEKGQEQASTTPLYPHTGSLATQGIILELIHHNRDNVGCVRIYLRKQNWMEASFQRYEDQSDGAWHAVTTYAMTTLMPTIGDNMIVAALLSITRSSDKQ